MLNSRQKALLKASKEIQNTLPYSPKKPTLILTEKPKPAPKRIYFRRGLV